MKKEQLIINNTPYYIMNATNIIIEEYYIFAKIISKRYCNQIGFDMTEDIEAEGFVGLVKAVNGHLPGRLSFKSWASFKIRSEIRDYIKRQLRGQKGEAKKQAITVPLEDVEISVDGAERKVYKKDQIRKLLRLIPKSWQEVIILYYVKGYNLREIGKIKGYTKANASRIKIKALRRMKKEGWANYGIRN